MASLTLRLSVSFALTCCAVRAQQVIQVAPGASINAAIAAANPGDILQLADAQYDYFQLDKGLTLVGPATIEEGFFSSGMINIGIPPGQSARLVDLNLVASFGLAGSPGGRVLVRFGSVAFENCFIDGTRSFLDSFRVTDADVVIERSLFRTGRGPSMIAVRSNIVAVDSQFFGVTTNDDPLGTPAILAMGPVGSIYLSNVLAFGAGDAGNSLFPPGPSLRSTVDTWIVDSQMIGGDSSSQVAVPGAPGVDVAKGTFARSVIVGGRNIANASFPAGPPFVGVLTEDPRMLGARSPIPPNRNSFFSVTWTAEGPGVPIVVGLSQGLRPPVLLPSLIEQPLWSTDIVVVGSLTTSSPGNDATFTVGIPGDPALRFASLAWHGFRLDGSRVVVAPVVASTVR